MVTATKIVTAKRSSGFLMIENRSAEGGKLMSLPELLGEMQCGIADNDELKAVGADPRKFLVTLTIEPLG